MRNALLLALLLPVAGCSAPELHGQGVETEHYSIRTDSASPSFARRVGAEAERIHALLERYFGGEPSRIAVLTLTDWRTYAALRAVEVSAGEYHHSWLSPSYVLNAWRGHGRGRKGMAHELVHHFVHELCPGMPLWANEGLAEALEHSSRPLAAVRLVDSDGATLGVREHDLASWSCPLITLRCVPRDRGWIARRLPELMAYQSSWDGPLVDKDLRLLAAAVMRFGMETQGWRTLREAADWRPNAAAFARWLAKGPTDHHRFPPLLDGSDAPGTPFAARAVVFTPPLPVELTSAEAR